jgi:hypothetical protein
LFAYTCLFQRHVQTATIKPLTICEHTSDLRGSVIVSQGVGIRQDQVGQFRSFNTAQGFETPLPFRGIPCGGLQRLCRR